MYQEERLLKILEYLKQHQSMSVAEICSEFDISKDTARRDIVRLVQEGVVISTHGGVSLPQLKKELLSYQDRLIDEAEPKRIIGLLGAQLIHDHETIILDVSTTVKFVAEQIKAQHLTIATHSIDNVGILSDREDMQIYLLGGYLNVKNRSLFGTSILDKLSEIRADKAFIGAVAIGSDGIYYSYEEDARVKREMARRSDQVIVVADHTKFTSKSFYRLDFDHVDILITNQPIPNSLKEILNQKNITVLTYQDHEEGIKNND